MVQKVIKTGNSLAVTIPSAFIKSAGIKAGDEVTLEISENQSQIAYFFSGVKQLPLLEMLSKKK